MKDIDFDELDKAVNSLMAKTPEGEEKEPAAPAEPAAETSSEPSQPAPAQEAAVPEPADTAEPAKEPAAVAPAAEEPSPESAPAAKSLATKRSGRFMDVVHPSSDMRSAPSATAQPSRHSKVIAPFSSDTASAPAEPTKEEAPTSEEVAAPAPAEHSWPDPIAMHEAAQNSQTAEPEAAPSEKSEPAPAPVAPSEPPVSPFLADAKVEKRPLGAPVTEAQELGLDTEAPQQTEAAEPAAPLPAELADDVVSIESDTTQHAESETTELPAVAETPSEPDIAPAKVEPEKAAPAGASSITQQYKVQENTGDQHHEALYDSASIEPPLQHPAKQKSGWFSVALIVLLLVVGIGGAVILWYLKII